jgi:hypothetical protein
MDRKTYKARQTAHVETLQDVVRRIKETEKGAPPVLGHGSYVKREIRRVAIHDIERALLELLRAF